MPVKPGKSAGANKAASKAVKSATGAASSGSAQAESSDDERPIRALVEELQAEVKQLRQKLDQQATELVILRAEKRAAATTVSSHADVAKRLAQVEERQEQAARRGLAATVVVHKYSARGSPEPSASDIQHDLLRTTCLPATAIASCVRIAATSSNPSGSGAAGNSSGSAASTSSGSGQPGARPATGAGPSGPPPPSPAFKPGFLNRTSKPATAAVSQQDAAGVRTRRMHDAEQAAGGDSQAQAGTTNTQQEQENQCAAADAPPAASAPGRAQVVCTTFKVVLNTAEAAKQVLITKAKHKQLGTGLVVRQALTLAEQQTQRHMMSLYRELRRQGVPADFRRGQLWARRDRKWAAVPPP